MNTAQQPFWQIVQEAFCDTDLNESEIPQLELYMDQIITLFERISSGGAAGSEAREPVLTKTMIHNYSKDGLLKKVKGKKYDREHILQMLLIYSMKSTLSIQQIKMVLDGVYRSGTFGEEELSGCYEAFLAVRQVQRETMPECIGEFLRRAQVEPETQEDLLVAVLGMCSASLYLKRIAEKMVEEYFPRALPGEKE